MEKHLIRIVYNDNLKDHLKDKPKQRDKKSDCIILYPTPNTSFLTKISDLDLSNTNLIDVKVSLKELPLKKLNLAGNLLTQIPRCFYLGLELLEFLDISNNNITSFEVEPNCCKTLKVLILCSNKLKDIPQWIMNHRALALKALYYDFNKITSLRCIFGSNMNFSVSKLSLRNCILRDQDCNFLKNCRYLEELDIGNVSDNASHLNFIKTIDKLLYQPNWKNLSVLKMNYASLSIFPEGLTWLEGLTELHLTNNNFTWLPTDGLEYFVNLEVFNISHNLISEIPKKLTWLEYMKVLNISYNKLEVPCDFSGMKSLEVLDLYNNKLKSLDHDLICTNLKCLDVEQNCFDTTQWHFLAYEEMRHKLRLTLVLENREDGVLKSNDANYQDNSEEELSEDSEDWDKELELEQITLSDDEWNGEAPSLPHIPINFYEKPSIYNDDVIFCDAD
ncbi:leucine-rich repeat and death domain-containing protein 1-like isoform X1 [Harmonia axyridis]|uniref:leucine-rich repeat and death domain-containing protein 1-like isoform X1 n=1 Tax=Harmonia axyridis TaxID=115357 RepID=UPI001E275D00|nr:leucine-rich repeat and death domain-containing protein 1-like isoform X1 [Harmonia axyridis]